MIYKARGRYARLPGIATRLYSGRQTMHGVGEGDYIRLRDEDGKVWTGTGSIEDDNTIRYRFRDGAGRFITGFGDSSGVVLRDERGATWRGYVD